MLLSFTKQHFLHPFRTFNYVLHMYSVCNFLDFCLTFYSCFYRIKFMFCSIFSLSRGFFVLVRLPPPHVSIAPCLQQIYVLLRVISFNRTVSANVKHFIPCPFVNWPKPCTCLREDVRTSLRSVYGNFDAATMDWVFLKFSAWLHAVAGHLPT